MGHREERPVTLSNKSSMAEEVILTEEDLTKEVEAEDEVERLSFGVTNATIWGISHLNSHEKKT